VKIFSQHQLQLFFINMILGNFLLEKVQKKLSQP